jgi:hypothetical protein
VALFAPATVGWTRFRGVIRASAELAFGFFSDLIDAALMNDINAWPDDHAALEKKDPCFCSAIAHGARP